MRNFSKSLFITVLFITLISCGREESAIRESAQNFLDLYLKADFDSAAKFCTPELIAGKLDSVRRPAEALDSGAAEIFRRQLAGIRAEIVSVEKRHKADSIKVTFKLLSDSDKKEESSLLIMVKSGEIWKVGKLGQ
jgi:hypothetical protein